MKMYGFGKIEFDHHCVVREKLNEYATNLGHGEYTVLYVGTGTPHSFNNISHWSEWIPSNQNTIFSDEKFTEERIKEVDFEQFGKLHRPENQKYEQIDVRDISLETDSVDIVFAIGLISKQVLWDDDLVVSLGEITRVLNHGGKLFCEMESEYVQEFRSIVKGDYELSQFSLDGRPLQVADILEISNIDRGVNRSLIELTVVTVDDA